MPFDSTRSGPAPIHMPVVALGATPGDALANPIEHYQAALAATSLHDLAAHQHTPAAVARTGARILTMLTAATLAHSTGAPTAHSTGNPTTYPTGDAQAPHPAGALAASLQASWAPADGAAARLFSAALILCADHELNVSAFTARCVASAGSSPYAVVIAALAALGGYRHGGHTAKAATLLSAAAAEGARAAIAACLRDGGTLPGFGHPLYPDGDPRAACLLDLLHAHHPASPILQVAGELCAVAHTALDQHPTIDFALAALAATVGAPRHAPLALFALGRTAGWLAHAIEQYALNQLIRPRARYTGPPPVAAG